MLNPKCFIVGGMILSSSLQVKAFTPTNNTAACAAAAATLVTNTAVLRANANKERDRDKNKEPGIVTTAFGFVALLFLAILLFMCLFGLVGLFLKEDNGI